MSFHRFDPDTSYNHHVWLFEWLGHCVIWFQVATFGCKAFALLFDDIDPELSEADRSAFSSFAHAQVSVANEVYEHLGQLKFLFCPTGMYVCSVL